MESKTRWGRYLAAESVQNEGAGTYKRKGLTVMAGVIFKSSASVLARAKEHIADLDTRVNAFLETKTHARVVEIDGAGNEIHKIKFTKPVPENFENIAFDAVSNLRACLDQAGYAIAKALNGGDPKSSYFPFGDDPVNLDGVMKGRCRDFPKEVLALFRAFKPYKGGDNLLWAVNRICNIDKHRLLAPVGLAVGGMHIKTMTVTAPSFSLPAPVWDKTKHEIVFGVIGPGGHIEYDLNIAFHVAFNEVEIVGGQPAVPVLKKMAEIVGFTLERMNAKAYKMGLLG